jgi:hypothetical protein
MLLLQIRNSPDSRSGKLFDSTRQTFPVRRLPLCLFNRRGIRSVFLRDQLPFPNLRHHAEFMRAGPTHHPRVRLDLQGVQSHPFKNLPVSPDHRLIAVLGRRLVGIKTVRILHDELSCPHQPKPRTNLIPILRLNLIQRPRQLPIALHLAGHQRRHHLLVGWSQNPATVLMILHMKENIRCRLNSSALLPQIGRL